MYMSRQREISYTVLLFHNTNETLRYMIPGRRILALPSPNTIAPPQVGGWLRACACICMHIQAYTCICVHMHAAR